MRPAPHEHEHERHDGEHDSDGDVPNEVDRLLGSSVEGWVGEVVFLEYSVAGDERHVGVSDGMEERWKCREWCSRVRETPGECLHHEAREHEHPVRRLRPAALPAEYPPRTYQARLPPSIGGKETAN